ncbi:MAG: sensor histidine kinase [Verrucomicrobiota bacterium]
MPDTPLRPGSSQIPHFAICHFLLDGEERIAEHDEGLRDRLPIEESSVVGSRLREVLIQLSPRWEQELPPRLASLREPLFLHWYNSEGEPTGEGLQLHAFKAALGLFVTLVPALPPHDQLRDLSVRDFGNDPRLLPKLLLRLQGAEARLAAYQANFPGILFIQRPDLSFSFLGERFESQFDLPVGTFLKSGTAFIDLIDERDREHALGELESQSEKGEPFSLSYRARIGSEGKIRYLLDMRTPRVTPSGMLIGYEGVWLDITRQSIAENRLSSTIWKENLATLTSGLVHDFSNIMAGIFSLSELYCSSLEPDHSMYRGMNQIKKNSMEARKLVRRIIELNREESGQASYHNLEEIVADQLDLINVILPKGSEVIFEPGGESLPVYLDDVAFRQTLLNLAINARDALDDRAGRIEIQLRKVPAGQPMCENCVSGTYTPATDGVELSFSDSGCGMSTEVAERIFEPFFTTKDTQKGSGFGLYNARLFFENLDGRIAVESAPGKGATFRMFLPLADLSSGKRITFADSDTTPPLPDAPEEDEGPRLRFVVYAAQDPSYFSLVQRMLGREWEIKCFEQQDALLHFLNDTRPPLDGVVLIYLGHDPGLPDTARAIRNTNPGLPLALVLMGCEADAVSTRERQTFDAVLDESCDVSQIIDTLSALSADS